LLGEAIVRQVSLLKRAIIEKIPSWVPRTVMHLNEWLDKAVETMLAFDLNPLDPDRSAAFDSHDLCSFSRLRASEHETEAQT